MDGGPAEADQPGAHRPAREWREGPRPCASREVGGHQQGHAGREQGAGQAHEQPTKAARQSAPGVTRARRHHAAALEDERRRHGDRNPGVDRHPRPRHDAGARRLCRSEVELVEVQQRDDQRQRGEHQHRPDGQPGPPPPGRPGARDLQDRARPVGRAEEYRRHGGVDGPGEPVLRAPREDGQLQTGQEHQGPRQHEDRAHGSGHGGIASTGVLPCHGVAAAAGWAAR